MFHRRTKRGTRSGVKFRPFINLQKAIVNFDQHLQQNENESSCPDSILSKSTKTIPNVFVIKKIHPLRLKLCLLNIQSACNEGFDIEETIIHQNIDMLALTETWLKPQSDESKIATMTPNGYKFEHKPRMSKGGGIAVIYREHLSLKFYPPKFIEVKSFEYLECLLTSAQTATRIIVVYRPPISKKNQLKTAIFHDEFSNLLEYVLSSKARPIILGDFNFHFDVQTNPDTVKLQTQLLTNNLIQHVSSPTHKKGHILDWVVSNDADRTVEEVTVSDLQISDHFLVSCLLNIPPPPKLLTEIKFRNLRRMNSEAFCHDLMTSKLFLHPPSTLDEFALNYNSTLRVLLDKHAPTKTKKIPYAMGVH
ncbi:hypothetical protein SNE40_009856 [Patella caerulea]|uniref:Endonuclease/exonuclease/phosphatase domain-containing protein n=1 Tax=Patella caerulea TaxID=87958 RepID=A0AAN8JZT3_PATCE